MIRRRDTGPMGSGNLEFVRSIYAAWERDDYSSTEWAHPDVEFVLADGPDPGSWRGRAGMAEGWRAFLSNWGITASRSRNIERSMPSASSCLFASAVAAGRAG
jgi:ketosteroid isomerase-like protein